MSAWLVMSLGAMFVAAVALVAAASGAWGAALPAELARPAPVPWAWRAAWPLVRRFAHAIGPWLSAQQRDRLRQLLGRAGLDRVMSAEHVVAAQAVSALNRHAPNSKGLG